jgi:type II secretory pathway pseudopilin PulG
MERAGGFTYIGVLVAVVIIGLMLTVVGRVWSTAAQREREAQLIWVGHQYRHAIASYYSKGNRYPDTLDQLVVDDRSPVPLHHLRRLYPDPITGKADWILVLTADGQKITGVASSSKAKPIKQAGFDPIDVDFEHTDCYCAWQFVHFLRRFNHSTGPDPSSTPTDPTTAPADPGFNPGHLGPLPGNGGLVAPGMTVPQQPATD